MKKILFLITEDWFFCSHFLDRAIGSKSAGFDVVVLARDTGSGKQIRSSFLRFIPLKIRRSGVNPFRDIGTILELWHHYRHERPDIVHHVAMKPIIYGTLIALLTGVPMIVNAPVGLGYAFASNTLRARLLRMVLVPALRLLMNPKGSKVVFENEDDLDDFVKRRIVREHDSVLIRGAGIDLNKFKVVPEPPKGPIVISLTARMLRDKGVYEFVEAAKKIRKQGVLARFILIGAPDVANPASISQSTLESWAGEGFVECLGHRTDIPDLLASSHIVCLPSYREGLPKSILEALASGRPVVTTNVPGCRQTVCSGYNGFLVEPHDVDSLAASLLRLINNPNERMAFGANGRKMAEKLFSKDIIVSSTIRLYESIQPL